MSFKARAIKAGFWIRVELIRIRPPRKKLDPDPTYFFFDSKFNIIDMLKESEEYGGGAGSDNKTHPEPDP